MEVNLDRVHWESVNKNAKLALRAIRELIEYLEGMKRELCLESVRLSSSEAVEYIGPGTEVALTGIVHAINYLSVCRSRIQETDSVLAKRFLTRLEIE